MEIKNWRIISKILHVFQSAQHSSTICNPEGKYKREVPGQRSAGTRGIQQCCRAVICALVLCAKTKFCRGVI